MEKKEEAVDLSCKEEISTTCGGKNATKIYFCPKDKKIYITCAGEKEIEKDGKGIGAWINLAIQEKNSLVIALGGNDNSRSMLKKIFQPMRNRTN